MGRVRVGFLRPQQLHQHTTAGRDGAPAQPASGGDAGEVRIGAVAGLGDQSGEPGCPADRSGW